uniref:Hydro-lyase, Fe-S type, tartrate/fumarate subfamily, alpha subunit n=1 Tax=uncultured organism TaxID=155900 RepID=M1P144_9ZZZZ|nr:hydro-lyase, Fe-S type, tartrate/fumarate subfamily, alpha subunit [uncultured organism]
MVSKEIFLENIVEMLELAATSLPQDVENALEKAREREENTIAQAQLDAILENVEVAREEKIPMCQDTGLPIFFIKKGTKTTLNFDLKKTLENAVKKATEKIPLRPNVVDPLSRKNSNDNTGEKHPLIHTELVKEDKLEVDIMLKGGGSENWSKLFMLNPTTTKQEITEKITNHVKKAGGQVCPPTILGIGIGGTATEANTLAKKTLLKPLNKENTQLTNLKNKIKKKTNNTKIGPMGLGGKTTVLDVKIEKAGCHTASLPIALNFHCWAARRAKGEFSNGKFDLKVPK